MDHSTTATAETARCVNCTRGIPGWDLPRLACQTCQQRTADQLAELPALLAELPARVVPGRGAPMVGSRHGAAGPRDPINLHVIALIDEAAPLLATWARDWSEVGGMPLAAVCADVCGWLRWHLDWACRQHPAIDEAMREIGAFHGRVRTAATGERGERPVRLQCPCGGIIPWRVSQDRYRCGGCGAVYGREEAAALPAASRVRAAA